MMEKPLVNKKYKLEKFPGKGGWTYARIPEILQDKHAHFGWVKVKGTIDGYEIKSYHLMPMGNGQLFLPVKASIRKLIKKQVGDYVKVVLFADADPLEIPEEFLLCLKDEPKAFKAFISFPESQQKAYLDWIYNVKKDATRIERMAIAINRAARGLYLYDKEEQ